MTVPKAISQKWISQQSTIANSIADPAEREKALTVVREAIEERRRYDDFLAWAESKYGRRNDYEVAGHAPGKALVKGKGAARKVTPIHTAWQDYCQANGIA